MLNNAPRSKDELSIVVHKRNPKTGLPGNSWRITLPAQQDGEPEWMPAARAARAAMRAHAAAVAADVIERFGGPGARLLSDEELVEYEAEASDSSDEEEAAKENAGAPPSRDNKAAAKERSAAKPAAAAAAKKAAKKRPAPAASESDSDVFEADEAPPAKKRKTLKKEKKEAAAALEPFHVTLAAAVDHRIASRSHLTQLVVGLGLDAPGAAGAELVLPARTLLALLRNSQ